MGDSLSYLDDLLLKKLFFFLNVQSIFPGQLRSCASLTEENDH